MKEPTQDRRRPGRARRLVALLGAALVLLVVLAGTNTLRNKVGIAITDDTDAGNITSSAETVTVPFAAEVNEPDTYVIGDTDTGATLASAATR